MPITNDRTYIGVLKRNFSLEVTKYERNLIFGFANLNDTNIFS